MRFENFGKSLDGIVDRTLRGAKDLCDATLYAGREVKKDITQTYSETKESISKTIDEIKDYEIGQEILNATDKGKESVKKFYHDNKDTYNTWIDQKVMDSPQVAGLIVGIMNSMIGTPTDRRPKSKIYNMHVKYGQWIGYGSSVGLLLKRKYALASIPVVSRAIRYGPTYLREKLQESK